MKVREREQLWYTRFIEYCNSGLSRAGYCRKNGLAPSTFTYWCRKFEECRINENANEEERSGKWYEVTCSESRQIKTISPMDAICNTIRLEYNGLKMEFPGETNTMFLSQIIRELIKS